MESSVPCAGTFLFCCNPPSKITACNQLSLALLCLRLSALITIFKGNNRCLRFFLPLGKGYTHSNVCSPWLGVTDPSEHRQLHIQPSFIFPLKRRGKEVLMRKSTNILQEPYFTLVIEMCLSPESCADIFHLQYFFLPAEKIGCYD